MRRRKLRPFIVSTLLPSCAIGLLLWAGAVLAETSAARRRTQSAAVSGHRTLTPRAALNPSLQFSSSDYSAGEGDGSVTINVHRSGDESVAASVDFATGSGTASDRADYTASLGTLHFAAGERSKSFNVLITDDGSVEGSETLNLTLSNPRGASLGDLCTAALTLLDNDATTPSTNPIDSAQFFVRQHYLDFLNREPDASGLQFWTGDLNSCGADAACLEVKKINVSAAFFLSIEFQQTGYLVFRAYQASYGRRIKSAVPLTLRELLPDTQAIGRGVVVGAPGWEQQVEANQQAFFDDFVLRPQFLSAYPTTISSSVFIDSLNANTGGSLSQAERDALVAELGSGIKTRAQALRAVCEDADFNAREKNRAFVLMQYYGYLRRNPDDAPEQNRDFSGYQFWLSKLDQFGGNFVRAEMVKAFLVSTEYRSRFVEDAKPNQAPIVNAGTDLTITMPETASLSGVVSDDGLPSGSSLSTLWSVVSGPGVVNFGSPDSATTSASFTAPGAYVLKLTASDTLLAGEDTVTVNVRPRNLPPTVDAGADQTIELPATANLSGTVSDDNLPQGSALAVNWARVSGPGIVSFANANSAQTTASFSAPGTYTLRLSVSDTEFSVSDQIIVTVQPQNRPPVVNAGPDQTVRVTHGADLVGSVTDDGLPQGSALTARWSKVSGPGVVSFRDANSPVTVATFGGVGTYVLRLTVSDSRLSASDEVTVIGQPAPRGPQVNAGPDQEITFPAVAALNGTATGDGSGGSPFITTWTKVSGPGSVTFADIHKPVTTCTFSVPGTYVLRLTADDGQFVNSDDATVTVRQGFASRVYTLNADFDEGSLINVTHSVPDQLQLDDTTRAFNFIWVAVSTKGTIVKIDTETGGVLGEYRTAPEGQPTNPSRTTVDHNGSVWTANRDGNSVVRVGLLENGQCVDRNGNGVIDTSHALGDFRAWPNTGGVDTDGGVETAADECIINYVRVNSFGTRHVSVNTDNDVWVSGTSGQRFDLIDGETGLIKRSEPSVGFGGYGGLIDRFGVIWSASPLLRWDTALPLTGPNGVNWRGYGHNSYGLCIDSKGNVWNTSVNNNQIHKFAPDGTLLGSFAHGDYWAQGCVVDKNDDVWVAHSHFVPSVGHLKSNGVFVGNISLPSGPTGVAVDSKGKIWTTNHNSGNVSRIDPNLGPVGADGVTRVGAVDFTSPHLGGNLYNYSDMTGSTLTGAPAEGTWSTVFDSHLAGAEWGRIGWTAKVCGDGSLNVAVASSEDSTTFSPAEIVMNGADPSVPNGRYLKISVSFRRAASGESPVLYDLSVGTQGFTLPASANTAPVVNAGPDQTITQPNAATLSGVACDDALPPGSRLTIAWEKVSGPGSVTFGDANSLNTTATFGAAGTYILRLSGSDSQFTSTDDVTITVNTVNQPPEIISEPVTSYQLPTTTGSAIVLNATVRDFNDTHQDFEKSIPGLVTGLVQSTLGPDNKPVFAGPNGSGAITSSDTFNQWYNNAPGVNLKTVLPLELRETSPGSGIFSYESSAFFPIDDQLFGNQGRSHNYHFTVELHSTFTYRGGEVFQFTGDDDVWVFIDKRLAVDLGGIHGAVSGSVSLDSLGLTVGETYSFDFFFAERHTFQSNFKLQTSINLRPDRQYTYPVEATDPDGDNLTYSLAVAPDGMQIDSSTGLVTWNPGADKVGAHNVSVRVSDGRGGTDTQSFVLQVLAPVNNQPPVVNAGPDQTLTLPSVADLNGTVSDDGLPVGSTVTTAWSKVSGPGTVSFGNPNTAATTAAFTLPGAYVLRLTASDTQLTGSDDVTVTVNQPNQPPVVNAGPDQTVVFGQMANLNGTATDDGLPAGASLSISWAKVIGPGSVMFANASSPNTTAAFSADGTYVLRLTASDTQFSSSDDVTVNVLTNRPPNVDAGLRQTIKLPDVVNLHGTVSDDGIPTGGTLTVTWSKVSGPGAVTFGNASAVDTNAAFSSIGYYVLRLTASDSLLSSHSDVTIKVLSADATPPGGVFVTGHDPDFHTAYNGPGASLNPTGAKHILQRAVEYVTFGKPTPRMLLITDVRDPGSSEFVDSRLGLQAAGFTFDVADYGSGQQGALDLHTVNFNNYDVLVVASDFGGWLRQEELDILNARRNEIASYVNNGGGLVALAESGSRPSTTTHDRYGFLPFLVSHLSLEHEEVGNKVTAAGLALGLTDEDVNGNAFHNFFTSTGGMDIIDVDPAGRILSLALRGKSVTGGGFANDAPIVSAGPDQNLTLPADTVTLNSLVSDDGQPQGAALTIQWSKVSGPGNVTFSSPNQPASNATFSEAGTYVLQLLANDTQLMSSDTVVVNVIADNQAPSVNAGPDQTIAFGDTATLSGTATDDGRPAGSTLSVSWTKVSGPGTVTFGNASQPATTATFSAGGRYVLRLAANDSQLTSSDDLTVTVNQAPVVNAGPDQTITLPSAATLNYTVSDDGLPAGSTTITWSKVSGPGAVNFASAGASTFTATFGEAGIYVLRLSADDSHLSAADEVTVTVNPAEPPPSVSIISPADESTLTTRADVIGSVSGGTWKLEHSLTGDEGSPTQWTTFAAGVGAVSNARLGVFDPTLLLNGRYLIRLSATNGGGQTSSASIGVVVSEEQKVGNFTISFSDLSVPVTGLPIEVVRTYDSRDKRQGDFGIGWTLGIRNVRLQESRAMGARWLGEVSPGFVPTYCITPARPHVVTVTVAESRVYKFEAVLNPGNGCQLGAPLREVTIGFRPLPGTNPGASLAAVGAEPLIVPGPFPGAFDLLDGNTVAAADYDQYQLTLEDDTALLIDQHTGLQRMTDTNGNTLTINAGGDIHSSGKSITFTRDAQGRITQITDPAGNPMTYAYDSRGDLVNFRDRENNVTTFGYNSTHGLLTIKDPRGAQPLRNEYDAEGRLVKQIDAFGKEVRFTHDLNARQETVFDRLGRPTIYDYDARGNVLRVQDADGKVTTRTYDARDNLLSETNALGKTSQYTYDDQDNRLSETDALNNKTLYTYNGRKQVLTVRDPAGGITTYTYDPNGNQTSVKDALGHTTGATFDARGLQLSSTDALGNITSFEYDASGNLAKQTDPLGNVSTYTYDANGNRLSESQTRTVGGATEALTTAFEYDKLGRQTKVIYPDGSTTQTVYNSIGKQAATIDQLGRRTSYEYDDMGQLVRTIYPDDTEEVSEYDFEGRRTKSIDRAGRATVYAYDVLGRLEKITFADGSTTTNAYDAIGQLTMTTDALGHITRYEYDDAGRRTKVRDALNNVTTFGYDANGNQTSVTDAKGQATSYVYDANNRRTKIIFPDNTEQTTVYDNLGQVTAKFDQAGVRTGYEYDKRGKLTKVTDALNGITNYTYDEQGNQLTQTDANSHTTSYVYDRMGRRMKRTLPLGMSETYAHDLAGNLTSRTDFRGKTTTFAHDVMNRVLRKTLDASLGETAVTFTYTATGRRLTMADASGTTTYTYDPRDRVLGKATPQGTLIYTYDGAGSVKSVRSSNANGVTVNYNYDELNRLSTVADNSISPGTTAYTYDLNGNLESTTYPNAVRTTYTYNKLNRLTNVNATKGSTLASYAYTLGEAGNRLTVTEADDRTIAYAYDALYRLTGETISSDTVAANNGSINYTYDAVGNRLNRASTVGAIPTTASTYDANDRLTSDAYDPNGNTTASNGNAYQYDSENRLTSLNGGAVTFVYDGDGNRVAKTVGGVTTRYLVDTNNHTGHAQVVEEIVGSTVSRTYTYGHDLISQTQLINNTRTTHFYGYDGHGSTRYLTDANGTITDTYTYDAFGNLTARTGVTPNDYLYSGEQYDPNIGFYYLRARWMNPEYGRFISRDSWEGILRDPVSLHKYLYANADPVNKIDPSGNFSLGEVTETVRLYGHLATHTIVSASRAVAAFSSASLTVLRIAFLRLQTSLHSGSRIVERLLTKGTVIRSASTGGWRVRIFKMRGTPERPSYEFFNIRNILRMEAHPLKPDWPRYIFYPHGHIDFLGKTIASKHLPVIELAAGLTGLATAILTDDDEEEEEPPPEPPAPE